MIGRARIWIAYEPYLYGDLLARLLGDRAMAQVVTNLSDEVDVIVFPTNAAGQPRLESLPTPVPQAKLIAFSPTGDCGWVRLPGHHDWEKVQPFGLSDLCNEVVAGRERPTAATRLG